MSFQSYSFLSCISCIKFDSTNSSHQPRAKTCGETIKSTEQELLTKRRINCCILEEADAWVMQHAICCVETGCNPIVIRTVNTDVLVLITSHSLFLNEINNSTKVFTKMGSNLKRIKVYDVTELASTIVHNFCKGLPFIYAFTGSNTVSGTYKCSCTTSFCQQKAVSPFTIWID